MVQAMPPGPMRIELVDRARLGIVLLDELDHHLAPLAIGRRMIERSLDAAVHRGGKRDVAQDEKRAGAEPPAVLGRCRWVIIPATLTRRRS